MLTFADVTQTGKPLQAAYRLKSIFSKIQVSNRTEAAAWYFAHKGE